MFEKLKEEPVIFMFQKMWKFSGSNKYKIVIFMILFLFSNTVLLITPLVFEALLNEIQHYGVTNENIFLIGMYLLSFLGLTLVFWILHGPARVLERENAMITEIHYMEHLSSLVLHQNLSWHAEKESGDSIDKIHQARNALFDFSQGFYNVMSILVKTVGALVLVSFFNFYISLFLLIFISFALYMVVFFDKKLIPQYKQLYKYQNNISARIFDAIGNITTVVILNIVHKIEQNLQKYIRLPLPLFVQNALLNEKKWFVLNVFMDVVLIVPLGFYIYYNFSTKSPVEVGSIAALYMYLRNITQSFFDFGGRYEGIVKQKTSILNAEEIEALDPNGSFSPVKKFSNWEILQIKNLEFSYTEGKKDLDLKNIVLNKGKKIAIIGESGGGKTTFLKTLHGLYSNTRSEIEIDRQILKTNFSDIGIESMLVPQEPELFSSSIQENITFGTDFSESEINEALEISQSKGFIETLPHGLQSVVNEKGVNLSGGQKQRVALARALLFAQHKQIILLDESTSSVDPENETLIYEKIFQKFSHTTIIASIHKMNLLKYFDEIIIFDQGKISDMGTFDHLLMRNKKFKSDWEKYIASHH